MQHVVHPDIGCDGGSDRAALHIGWQPRAEEGWNLSLDINTPQGRIHAAQQEEAANIVFKNGPNRFLHTRTNQSSFVDGVIADPDGYICGIAEIKARPKMTKSQLFGEFRGEWLITMNKVNFLASSCVIFCVPGYGMLYLVPEETVLMIKICEPSGLYCCDIRHERTVTQATCNGGTAFRDNAFIQMNTAKAYRK